MSIPPTIQRRREVEDRAIALGAERREIDDRHIENTRAIQALLPDAIAAGVPIEHLADLVFVSRQTLHAWLRHLRSLES